MGKKKISVEVDEAEADKVVAAVEAAETEAGGEVVEPTVEDVAEAPADVPAPEAPTSEDLPVPEAPAEPTVEPAPEAPVETPAPAAELPTDAHSYYVWKDGVFIKFFTNEEYKGEALKFARQYADEIGGTVEI